MAELLLVKNLQTQFKVQGGLIKAVDGVSYHINEKEIVGVVGESGCGKSVTQLSILQLINAPGEIVGGEIIFEGKDLLQYKANSAEMRAIRGAKIGMIFQEPMTSLNPVLTIGQQLTEGLKLHLNMAPKEADDYAAKLLSNVGIPDAARRLSDYPHQYSGGMRQRVMIAIGLSCSPKMLIADEPTTALDVTTQAQLLDLMTDMVDRLGASLVIVTHNLGVVARYAHRIYIMYAGRIVEAGTTMEIFTHPRHPYTISLLKCVPRLDEAIGTKLVPIVGMPPNLVNMRPNCAFLPRCPYHVEQCRRMPWPELRVVGDDNHMVSCYIEP